MVTIKDVAKEAGVSPTTVSYVINGTRLVSKETQAKVLQAIEKLGYRPNTIARSLRSKKTYTVGLIVCDLKNPFFAEVLQGIEEQLNEKGYTLLVIDTNYDAKEEERAIEALLSRQVDGAIAVLGGEGNRNLRMFRERNIPLVLLDKRAQGEEWADTVLVDNRGGSRRLVEYIFSLGYRRVGIIAGPLTTTTGRERLEGYLEALQSFSISRDDRLIKIGDFRRESGYRIALDFLSSPSPPEVIYACNNLMCLGAMEAIREKGIRVPEEIGIAVFDDLPWFQFTDPPLTAISQPSFHLGETAARLLLERMRGRRKKRKEVVLDVHLEIRYSLRSWERKGGGT